MNAWKVILATVVIFGAGVVTGLLLGPHSRGLVSSSAQPGSSTGHPTQSGPSGGLKLEFLRRMQRELGLTPEQRQRVEAIISQGQERTRKLMEPIAPQLREELQKAKQEFCEVLTPEQRTRFDQLWKQRQHSPEQRRNQSTRQRSAESSTLASPSPATNR